MQLGVFRPRQTYAKLYYFSKYN